MAIPETTVLLTDNKTLASGTTATFEGAFEISTGEVVEDTTVLAGRYPVENLVDPIRGKRTRVDWGSIVTQSGVKQSACRFIIDCGVPVSAEAIGLIDCNAKAGMVRFIGTDSVGLLTPTYSGNVGTNGALTQDSIYIDAYITEAPVSGIQMYYPELTEWAWITRAQLDYGSYIANSTYKIPASVPEPAGLSTTGLNLTSDRRSHQLRASRGGALDGEADLRPHSIRLPTNYVDLNGTGYGTTAGNDPLPIIGPRLTDVTGQNISEERNTVTAQRGKENSTSLRGLGGVDPINWFGADLRTSTTENIFLNQATKPVAYKRIGDSPATGLTVWKRDCGNALGSSYVNITISAKLEADPGAGDRWWNLAQRDSTNYSGFAVATGMGAANTIRVYHWQPDTHPGVDFVWDIADTYLDGWHVWQFSRQGSNTEEVQFIIDDIPQANIDVFTQEGTTVSFGAINLYRMGHTSPNARQTALSSPSAVVFGAASFAGMSFKDWGYGMALPTDGDTRRMELEADYQMHSYDIGLREDTMKRRYWAVEFDELRGDMQIEDDYLELGGVWIGDRTDLESTGRVDINTKRVGASTSLSYSGNTSVVNGRPIRKAGITIDSETIAEGAQRVADLQSTTAGQMVVDLHPNNATLRDSGLLMGAPGESSVKLASHEGTSVELGVQEDKPFVSYTSPTYTAQTGFTAHHGGVVNASTKAVAPGSLMIKDALIQPSQRVHFEVSRAGDTTFRAIGPGNGPMLTAGFLKPTYDPANGLPTVADWDCAMRVVAQGDIKGKVGELTADTTVNDFQRPQIIDGVLAATNSALTGDMFGVDRAIQIDYLANKTATATFGAGTAASSATAITTYSVTSAAIYGARRFAMYYSGAYDEGFNEYVLPKENFGQFPDAVTIYTIP